MNDTIIKAIGIAIVGAAGALANAHVIDPSVVAMIAAAVNFVAGVFHSRPNH